MENLAKDLLDLKMCSFHPKHKRNLSNEFRCFVNYPSQLLSSGADGGDRWLGRRFGSEPPLGLWCRWRQWRRIKKQNFIWKYFNWKQFQVEMGVNVKRRNFNRDVSLCCRLGFGFTSLFVKWQNQLSVEDQVTRALSPLLGHILAVTAPCWRGCTIMN